MVFEQRDRTLKDALSILQIALLGGSKTLCQRLVGLAESFDWTCGRFLFLFVCHGFAPSRIETVKLHLRGEVFSEIMMGPLPLKDIADASRCLCIVQSLHHNMVTTVRPSPLLAERVSYIYVCADAPPPARRPAVKRGSRHGFPRHPGGRASPVRGTVFAHQPGLLQPASRSKNVFRLQMEWDCWLQRHLVLLLKKLRACQEYLSEQRTTYQK